MRSLLLCFGLAILIGQTLMTAFVPVEVLLLGEHDHLIIGSISQDAWRAHEQAHLRMAMEMGMGATHARKMSPQAPTPAASSLTGTASATASAPHASAPQPNTGIILSAPGCDLQGLMSRFGLSALGWLHAPSALTGALQHTALPQPPVPIKRRLALDVPCPPPRS